MAATVRRGHPGPTGPMEHRPPHQLQEVQVATASGAAMPRVVRFIWTAPPRQLLVSSAAPLSITKHSRVKEEAAARAETVEAVPTNSNSSSEGMAALAEAAARAAMPSVAPFSTPPAHSSFKG